MRAWTGKAATPAGKNGTQLRPFWCMVAALLGLVVPLAASASFNAWTTAPSLLVKRSELGGVSAPCRSDLTATCVYAIGGALYGTPINSAEMYVPGSAMWAAIASMHINREGLGVASAPCQGDLNNICIYAMGGTSVYGSSTYTNTVEMYTPSSNSWTLVAPMHTARVTLAATSGPCQGNLSATCVYAIGGNSGTADLASVEMYTPGSNSWTLVAPMHTARADLASASGPCQGDLNFTCVYAIGGGNSGSGALSSVEMYAPGSNSWTTVAPLQRTEALIAATSAPCQGALSDTCIYALGGTYFVGGTSASTLTDMYNPRSNTWASEANTHADHLDLGAATAPCDSTAGTPCLYAIGGSAPAVSDSETTVETYQPSSAPTAAWVARFTAQRHGTTVRFHWQVGRPTGLAGFDLYAGNTRLNARTIAVHSASHYQYSVHWSGLAHFTLRVLLRNGTVATAETG